MIITALDFLVVCLVMIYYLRKTGSRGSGLPPGPPTLPFVGNIHQLPKEHLWVRFTEWSNKYGGIFSLKIASQTAIIVTSPRLVRDFMDRRGQSLSGRPSMKLADMITDGLHIGFSQGRIWRLQRRALLNLLSSRACIRHLPIQQAEAIQFLYDLVKDPKNFFNHTQRQFTSVMLSATFGTRCPRYNDSLASEFCSIERDFDELLDPGVHPPIDVVPLLQYIPERWAPWKTICRNLRIRQQTFYHGLMEACERRMKDSRSNGCFLEDIIKNQESLELSRDMIASLGGVSLEGGANTTAASIHRFILCMMRYPEVQRKGQAEMDSIVGSQRMPHMNDIMHLPYVRAIIKEVHRFYPTAPLAIPHANTEDEFVNEYFIPKGSTVFMNIYGIYHSEDLFDEPNSFRPERFLHSEFGTKTGADTTGLRSDLHFGSGRRICPGMHLANNGVVINVLNILWAFDIFPVPGDKRNSLLPITLEDFLPGLTIGPKPFKCDIQPRSEKHAASIRKAFSEARSTFCMFEQELTDDEKAFIEQW